MPLFPICLPLAGSGFFPRRARAAARARPTPIARARVRARRHPRPARFARDTPARDCLAGLESRRRGASPQRHRASRASRLRAVPRRDARGPGRPRATRPVSASPAARARPRSLASRFERPLAGLGLPAARRPAASPPRARASPQTLKAHVATTHSSPLRRAREGARPGCRSHEPPAGGGSQAQLKRLVQSPNSFFMDVVPGCGITTVFSHRSGGAVRLLLRGALPAHRRSRAPHGGVQLPPQGRLIGAR